MTELETPRAAPLVEHPPEAAAATPPEPKRKRTLFVIAGATLGLALLGGLMIWHADHKVNRTPMAGVARPVTVVDAKASSFRDSRTYVRTIEPWVEADIGPQYISAYVQTVLVRPGDVVTRVRSSPLSTAPTRARRTETTPLR